MVMGNVNTHGPEVERDADDSLLHSARRKCEIEDDITLLDGHGDESGTAMDYENVCLFVVTVCILTLV
jgi:hypothetical protein